MPSRDGKQAGGDAGVPSLPPNTLLILPAHEEQRSSRKRQCDRAEKTELHFRAAGVAGKEGALQSADRYP